MRLTYFCRLVVVSAVLFGSCYCGEDALAQSELLNNDRSAAGFSGGMLVGLENTVTITTFTFSLAIRGRLDFGFQIARVEGVSQRALGGAFHLLKPSEYSPFGFAATASVGNHRDSKFYGAALYMRFEGRKGAQFVPSLTYGTTSFGGRFRSGRHTTIIAGFTLTSRLANGARAVVTPQYQWQEGRGSIVGIQFGFLFVDPDYVKNNDKTDMNDWEESDL